MTYKKYENDTYNLYTIKTNKFKTCLLEIIFRKKINKEEITIKNMLVGLLGYTSKKYPKKKNLVEKLEDLYSSNLYTGNQRVGNLSFSNFVFEFLDPKYCDEDYLKEALTFPFEMLLNPNVENNEFDPTSFKIIKNRIRANILSIKEQPNSYAMKRAYENLDSNSVISYQTLGYLEDLESLTEEDLYKYYKEFMKDTICDVFVIGNLDMEYVNQTINEVFQKKYIKEFNEEFYCTHNLPKKVINVVEKEPFEQSILIELFDTKEFTERERNYTIHLFNYIFGNGSLTTKLYQYLREKNSLCYNTYSIYQKLDQLLAVYVGIDSKNKNKCIKLIDKALKEMVDGKFSDEEIEYAKKSLKETLKASLDNPTEILDNYVFSNYIDTPLIQDRIKQIDKITKKEITAVAKKIKLKEVYLLEGEASNEEN